MPVGSGAYPPNPETGVSDGIYLERAGRLDRIRESMARDGLDAYVATTPSSILYLTGFRSNFASTYWRMMDTVYAILPIDGARPIGLVLMDAEAPAARSDAPDTLIFQYPAWMELRSLAEVTHDVEDGHGAARPAQFERSDQIASLKLAMASLGIRGGRIGVDLAHITSAGLGRLQESVAAQWVSFDESLNKVRSIKDTDEIEALRKCTELVEAGFERVMASAKVGDSAEDLVAVFQSGVGDAARANQRYAGFSHAWAGIEVGPRVIHPTSRLAPGTLVKMDCGVAVDNYCGDGGRTFAWGDIDSDTSRMYHVLQEAQSLARAALTPGRVISEVFRVAQTHVRASGYRSYTRGHFGHSVGLDNFTEEPPYISVDEQTILEPGMVMAIEAPFYGLTSGCIQIEDLVLITPTGQEVLNRLTTDLIVR